ncbi:MAG: glucose-6-phosphate isomerase, partial [Propionibacteriaceae bacterium]|nr:glucose-6-phosphate isomerase [Propionibacteriaceae bacterium]
MTLIDASRTSAWARLTELAASLQPDLPGWFAADPARSERLSFKAGELFVDLSKNLLTDDVLAAL